MTAVAIVLVVAVQILNLSLAFATWRSTIPPSCAEPSTIDYSKVGRPDYGPYAVKFNAWHHAPWDESSSAVVGHDLSDGRGADYGVHLNLESTDLDHFQCRWSNTGVTIVEPDHPGVSAGIEHFVPAALFLGGR